MKVRRIDYSAGDMLSDIAGEVTPAEFGVYWMICTLIYRRREAIADDEQWLADKFRRSKTDPRTVRAAIEQLVRLGKVERTDGKLMVKRCRDEIEKASKRIQTWTENGMNGGRPPRQMEEETSDNNGSLEPNGSGAGNPAANTSSSSSPSPSSFKRGARAPFVGGKGRGDGGADPEKSWDIRAAAYAELLGKGRSLGVNASDEDIRRLVREGFITREVAEKAGYALWQ